MAEFSVRLLQCFERAKVVNHYYWMHTDADNGGAVRVENLQHVIERMTRTKVEKYSVPFDGTIIRGLYERYTDRVVIYIRKGQSLEWVRYTIVKELCHLLNDQQSEFSPKGEDTIKELVKFAGLAPGDGMSDVMQSERLAEITALELVYPLEFREQDRSALQNGSTFADIARKRQVPSAWVQRGTTAAYIESCKTYWRVLPNTVPPSLEPL